MIMFYIQSALLLAIAFALGCVLGSLLHRWTSVGEISRESADPQASLPAVAPMAAVQAAGEPAPAAMQAPARRKAPAATRSAVVTGTAAKKPGKAAPKAAGVKIVTAVEKPEKREKAARPAAKHAPAQRDDLKRIEGIGPANERKLNALGITAFSQMAAWSKKEQAEIGEKLAFPGRIEREEWVKQARALMPRTGAAPAAGAEKPKTPAPSVKTGPKTPKPRKG